MTDSEVFLDERRRARRFFNRMSRLYPIVERVFARENLNSVQGER